MESTKLSYASESLLRMANEMKDIEEEEEDTLSSGSLNEYQAQLNQFRADQEKTKAVLEKIKKEDQNHSISYMNDQNELGDKIQEIQKQMADLEAEKQRLLNEHFSSLNGVSDITFSRSSFMMSNTPIQPKSILKKLTKTPEVSQLDSSFDQNGNLEIAPSPIQKDKISTLNAKILEEASYREQICQLFIDFVDTVKEKYGESTSFEDIKSTLSKLSNERSNVDVYLRNIDSMILKIKNGSPQKKQSSPQRPKINKDDERIKVLSKKCHEIAENVLQVFDYTAPSEEEIINNPNVLNELSNDIKLLVTNKVSEYNKTIMILNEQIKNYQRQTLSNQSQATINDVMKLMNQIKQETEQNHKALFH
ncbi:hypothetical protein TVAG_071320 [Trichomonas vaginalis G3]|uniref:Uncharacterized protein n=1 Tax=Trichomonas vaginalis (strain ATCC PRA-98 / G3) TaxID=412133 RepID=A2D835_TRIV3|nr:hypothetical protein TVAGG3_1046150 [Trichomonas vaginalis G3]EAY23468.1 hypothetical protein TVAG_071320 [Trichomonas vaginalis G3]KAI5493885.1 hypothetical protein TVAGG3_1046150 [Trichomonas vaginalis G3]|eukprot:XP_001584454.1 hypothetical protein [Trichomonas vaginalis G3]